MQNIELLVSDATIITMNKERKILTQTSMAVDRGKIIAIGGREDLLKKYKPEKTLHAQNRFVYPGLINTHNHFFQVLLKGLGKDRRLLDWFDSSAGRAYRYIGEKEIYLATAIGAIEMLKTGVTTVLDYQYAHAHPYLSDAVIRAMEDVGIRGILGRGYNDTINFPKDSKCEHDETEEEFFQDVTRLSELTSNHPTMDVAIAPGIIWSLSEDGYYQCVQLARELDTFMTMHTIETKEDNEYSINRYGVKTLQFFERVGILSAPFLAVHCAEITPEEIDLLAKYDVRVSYNAISNMMMGYKTLPVDDLLRKNISVGLATDGAASNDNQDMLQVLKISPLWQKAFYQDPSVLSSSKILEMATIDGARCVFKDKEIGSLEVGKRADFFIYNPMQCNSAPVVDPVVNIVYSAGTQNIETTVVEGKVVYHQGKIFGVDEEQLLMEIQERATRLWEKAGLFNTQWSEAVDYMRF